MLVWVFFFENQHRPARFFFNMEDEKSQCQKLTVLFKRYIDWRLKYVFLFQTFDSVMLALTGS